MCGIFCSNNETKFNELYELNKHRGDESKVSVTNVFENHKVISSEFDSKALYNIGHIQAPTDQLSQEICTQPVALDDDILIHNGMLKQSFIKQHSKYQSTFDSYIMLRMIQEYDLINALNDMDGSFGCVLMLDMQMYIFRNNPGILFVDDELNISSTEFNNSKMIKNNVILQVNLENMSLDEVGAFTSISNPYFIL